MSKYVWDAQSGGAKQQLKVCGWTGFARGTLGFLKNL